jgi:hypothetical protein
MFSTPRIQRLKAALAALAVMVSQRVMHADLAPSSPFLPANASALGIAAGPSGPIELRGIMGTSDGAQYCIYDSTKKKDVWVGLNETGHDFVVKNADPNEDRVTVEYQGRILRLDLHVAKVASSGTAAAPSYVTSQTLAVTNPSPADEQRRLDAVAQEVRRRRMERERAIQEPPGGVPTPGSPPAPNR